MVVGPILAIGVAIGAIIFFKDDIGQALKDLNPIGKTQEAVSKAGEDVFNFGVETRANLDRQILATNIKAKESEIRKQAEEAGFSSLEEFERATDTCSLVVGGTRNFCDVGMIGVDDTLLTQRFGGKSNIGTDTTKILGKAIVKPQILSTSIGSRGSRRFNR